MQRLPLRIPAVLVLLGASSLAHAGAFLRVWETRRGSTGGPLAVRAADLSASSFIDSIRTASECGAHGIVLTPELRIAGGVSERIGPEMGVEASGRIRAVLAECGVRIVAFDAGAPEDAAAWDRALRCARLFGIPYMIADAPASLPAGITAQCRAYGVHLALRNTPPGGPCPTPEALRKTVQSLHAEGWIGVCADTGRWLRAGLDPAQCVSGPIARNISVLYLEDLDLASKAGRTVLPGTGVCRIPRVLAAVKTHAFHGPIVLKAPGISKSGARTAYLKTGLAYLERCRALSAGQLLAGKALPPGMTWNVLEVEKPLHPERNPLWPRPEAPDLSGYIDTTEGPGGKISAGSKGVAPRENYPNVFDNKPSKWCTRSTAPWIIYQYPHGKKYRITAYTVTSANDAPERDPRDWLLLGSNDGVHWTVVDKRKKVLFLLRHQKKLFRVQHPGAFNQYKFQVIRNHGSPDLTQMQEIELLAPKN